MLALGLTFCLSVQLPVEAVAQPNEMSPIGDRSGGYTAIDSTQLSRMLDDRNFFFVNVHIPYEGKINGTDSLIPFNEIAENLDKFPSDKRERIVLYCKSGPMSEFAAQELSRLGYSNVSHLVGGMIDWQKSGHAINGK